MSLPAITWAIYSAPVEGPAEWSILVAMADVADEHGRGSHLSIETIAKRTMLGESTVRRHRAAMQQRGLIVVSDDAPPSLLAISPDRRPINFDLNLGMKRTDGTGCQNERPLAVTPEPTTYLTTNQETLVGGAAADNMIVQPLGASAGGNLDGQQPLAEDAPTSPVTARNQGIHWQEVHLLRSWFHVEQPEQVESWQAAWRTGVEVASEGYDPRVHLVTYLTRCHEEKRDPKPGLWLKFLIEDRQRYLLEQKALGDRLEQQAAADGGESWALSSLKRTPRWGRDEDA